MAEVLIIGSGGREAALEQSMIASDEVERVIVTNDVSTGIEQFSGNKKPLVIVGPELPLVQGLADELRAEGYLVFGASKAAARYEASKSFAVRMMERAGVLHPETHSVRTESEAAEFILNNSPTNYMIKADGLAGGKGVVLPSTRTEALDAALGMLSGDFYDGAGKEIVNFAQRHSGPEVSAMIVVGDNDEFTILPLAQDHKRLSEDDTGPNTGGMGAYAPVPVSIISNGQYAQLFESVEKTLKGMRTSGTPFERGLLYGGFMLSEQQEGKPVVIEYNVRFGDPETQVILPLVREAGVDMYNLLRSAAEGGLEKPDVDFAKLAISALTVCLAAPGYPNNPQKGADIYGIDNDYTDVDLQLAGVKNSKVSGGRVLYVTGTGKTIDQAAANAYAAIDVQRVGSQTNKVGFAGMQFRKDIGRQVRARF